MHAENAWLPHLFLGRNSVFSQIMANSSPVGQGHKDTQSSISLRTGLQSWVLQEGHSHGLTATAVFLFAPAAGLPKIFNVKVSFSCSSSMDLVYLFNSINANHFANSLVEMQHVHILNKDYLSNCLLKTINCNHIQHVTVNFKHMSSEPSSCLGALCSRWSGSLAGTHKWTLEN